MEILNLELLLLHANVVPEIIEPVQRGPLLMGDLGFLHSIEPGQLAHSVPETGSTTRVNISDYFWGIGEVKRIILLTGLLLLSKFGYILAGKYHDPTVDAKDVISTYLTAPHDQYLCDMCNLVFY